MADKSLEFVSANQTVPDPNKDEKPFEFNIRWEIDNFSEVSINKWILSPPCIVHNLAWRIMIKRTGQYSESKLGYFLVCKPDSPNIKDSWCCKASAKLYVINQQDPNKHLSGEIQHVFCSKENDWGYRSFSDWDNISDPKGPYISNGTVKFDIHIDADRPEGIDVSEPSKDGKPDIIEEAPGCSISEPVAMSSVLSNEEEEKKRLSTTSLKNEMEGPASKMDRLLTIEEEKMKLIENYFGNHRTNPPPTTYADVQFFESLLPFIKELTPLEKLQVRSKIQLAVTEAYEVHASTKVVPQN